MDGNNDINQEALELLIHMVEEQKEQIEQLNKVVLLMGDKMADLREKLDALSSSSASAEEVIQLRKKLNALEATNKNAVAEINAQLNALETSNQNTHRDMQLLGLSAYAEDELAAYQQGIVDGWCDDIEDGFDRDLPLTDEELKARAAEYNRRRLGR